MNITSKMEIQRK